ncbi:MAG: DNA alkylation repair protein [Flavobacteriales bacterium]|nr:DNA alkylation repair protein [Flavobacteriales bacterium]
MGSKARPVYLIPLTAVLEQRACPTDAAAMQAYMKGLFPFYGIKATQRRQLLADFMKENGMPTPFDPEVLLALWAAPQREFQHCALDIMRRQVRSIREGDLALVEELIVTKSWWDTVDGLSSWIVGPYFLKFPGHKAEITGQWAIHENLWLRRASIIFQLGYKQKTDTELLFRHIRLNLGSKEFFINKAIGWALREYARTDAEAVRQFVSTTELSPLSRREAMKHL